MRIITANVNGMRSATSKGFLAWLATTNADFVCVQELKAQENDLSFDMKNPCGMYGAFAFAEKKGYSGVALYSRQKPDSVQIGFGVEEFDREGRFVRADFDDLSIISLYLPSGSASDERQASKFRFLDAFRPILDELIAENRKIAVCGDWNIAHQNIDLKNWKGNLKNSGFLPEERQWISDLIASGWTDIWRTLYPDIAGYSWWSNRGQAYAKDVGWRIDYQMLSPTLAPFAQSALIYKDEKFSDHAPLIVDYDL
ncbi:MAG: exodeoxyribonuclease III [Neisseriaceae bacterium]|nr:exodeoxyribonuclease III [Neisseriaceae bacterium]